MRKIWAASVVAAGLLLVGVVYACIWYAIPQSGIARDWPNYIPLLLVPYLLGAFGYLLSPGWLPRPFCGLIALGGVWIAGFAVADVQRP